MTRLRPVVAASCLAVLLFAAVSTPGAAQRDAQQFSAIADGATSGVGLFGSWAGWGQFALNWLQAIFAAEHGHIVESPVVPTTPPTTP